MIRNIYTIPLALSIGLWIGVSGCTQQKTISVATPTPTAIPTVNPLTENEKASKFLDSYLKEVTTAGDGSVYYCKPDNVFTFYSPRKYEILRVEPGNQKAMIVRTRLESSNAGGQSIIKDWTFILMKQKPDSAVLLKEAGEYGYCIRLVSDKF